MKNGRRSHHPFLAHGALEIYITIMFVFRNWRSCTRNNSIGLIRSGRGKLCIPTGYFYGFVAFCIQEYNSIITCSFSSDLLESQLEPQLTEMFRTEKNKDIKRVLCPAFRTHEFGTHELFMWLQNSIHEHFLKHSWKYPVGLIVLHWTDFDKLHGGLNLRMMKLLFLYS